MIETLKQNKELWELFTKREEYNPTILDRYQRYPYRISKHKNVLEPEVSKFLLENGLEVGYPEGKKFAVCLTHDIDTLYPSKSSTIYCAIRSLRCGQTKNAFKILLSNIKR